MGTLKRISHNEIRLRMIDRFDPLELIEILGWDTEELVLRMSGKDINDHLDELSDYIGNPEEDEEYDDTALLG